MRYRDILTHDHTLFVDREVFEADFVPGQFGHREAQIRELAWLAAPGLQGNTPSCAILRGRPGTGKTTSVLRLFSEIEEATRRLAPVHVNCQNERTRYAVFARVLEHLAGHPLPASGNPLHEVLRQIARRCQDRKCALLVCLDDANYLVREHELNAVLYTLLRLHESFGSVRAGVFAVISDMNLDLRREVDSRVFSVFHPEEVFFPPYTRDEVREILDQRIKQGLFPGAMDARAMDRIVAFAGAEGDIRAGIDLVRKSAEHAEREGRSQVLARDVEAAASAVGAPVLRRLAAHLREPERDLLFALARLSAGGGEHMTAGEVFRAVREELPLSYTTFHERLKKFEKDGILALPLAAEGGRRREIAFRYDPMEVMEACEEYAVP
jgi:cell division control protein 6